MTLGSNCCEGTGLALLSLYVRLRVQSAGVSRPCHVVAKSDVVDGRAAHADRLPALPDQAHEAHAIVWDSDEGLSEVAYEVAYMETDASWVADPSAERRQSRF
jgi:hypothetical protein